MEEFLKLSENHITVFGLFYASVRCKHFESVQFLCANNILTHILETSVFFQQEEEDDNDGTMKVELRIFLPDDSITTVTVLKCQKTDEVYQVTLLENLTLYMCTDGEQSIYKVQKSLKFQVALEILLQQCIQTSFECSVRLSHSSFKGGKFLKKAVVLHRQEY